MFTFQVYVDDKKLAYVLWALAGHVIQMSPPQPVTNVVKGRNGLTAEVPSGDSVQRLEKWLAERKLKKVAALDIKQFCQEAGLSTTSYSNMITRAKAAGLLKRVKRAGFKAKFDYLVTGAK
jgi:hypothetical protein